MVLPTTITNCPGTRPKVSVAMLAYNHEAFIAEALESVLSQEVPFDLEVVIGEDFSSDKTRAILESYAGEDERIRLLLHTERLGPHETYLEGKNNFITTYRECRGEYIAFLDGDDHWTDDAKLRRQVELLDAHPDYAYCFHPVAIEYSDHRIRHWPELAGASTKSVFSLEDIVRLETKPEIPMASMMIRSKLLPDFPPWFREIVNGDYAMQLLLARHGRIGYLPSCMAVHRKHGAGISRIYDDDPHLSQRMLLKLHEALIEEVDPGLRHILARYIEHEHQLVEVADRFASLEHALPDRVIAVPLEGIVARNESSLIPGHRVTVVTQPRAWEYAASLTLPSGTPASTGSEVAFLRIRTRSVHANAGIGVVDGDGELFIDRKCIEPSTEPRDVMLRIPSLVDGTQLIVQSWAAPESATVYIDSVDLMLYSSGATSSDGGRTRV